MIKNLRSIREQRGLNQSQLAALSNVNRVNISQYEIGVRKPNLTTTQKLAAALGCTIEDLIGDDGGKAAG